MAKLTVYLDDGSSYEVSRALYSHYVRRNQKMLEMVVECVDAGKPVASICHGPWMLCSARRANGDDD